MEACAGAGRGNSWAESKSRLQCREGAGGGHGGGAPGGGGQGAGVWLPPRARLRPNRPVAMGQQVALQGQVLAPGRRKRGVARAAELRRVDPAGGGPSALPPVPPLEGVPSGEGEAPCGCPRDDQPRARRYPDPREHGRA